MSIQIPEVCVFNLVEILRLVIALALLPLALMLARGVREVAGRNYYILAVAGVYIGMVLTILENFPGASEVLNTLQHLGYGIAGVFAAFGAYATYRAAVRANGGV